MCHFHVVTSSLSLPRCRFHVVASTLSLFYRGVTFKFLTKILPAALLFYNVCSTPAISMLSLLRCRFHVIASTLSLPRCRFHAVASTLSLPRCRYPGYLETVLNMADMFYLQIFIIVIFSFLLSFGRCVIPGFPCSTTARRQKVQKPASMVLQYYTYWRIIWFNERKKKNNNNTLYYSVKSSSKATQSSLIGDTVHNTGISLLLSTSAWVLLSPPIEH